MGVVRSLCVVAAFLGTSLAYETIYAVNFGPGGKTTDSQGIVYEEDKSSYKKVTVDGPYASRITGCTENDKKIYQTYVADDEKMVFEVPNISKDGKYLLVFKLTSHSFQHIRKLNMILNDQHQAVTNLDVYKLFGEYAAFDEYVFFSVCNGQLLYKNQRSDIKDNKFSVRFEKNKSRHYSAGIAVSAMLILSGEDLDKYPILPIGFNNYQSSSAQTSHLYQQLVHKCQKTTCGGVNKQFTITVTV
jgi:Malectin domain